MSTITPSVYGSTNLDPSAFMGMVIFYRAHNVRLPHGSGVKLFDEMGMEEVARPLPGCPRDVDVFARVMSEYKAKEVEEPKITVRYLIRPVSKTVRTVVRERVNKKGERLGHKPIISVRWTAEGVAKEFYEDDPLGVSHADLAIAEYESWRGCLTSYAMREWCRESILGLQAVALKNGVYFVVKDVVPKVERIEDFCTRIPGRLEISSLPLIDSDKQRTLVERAFEDEVLATMESLRSEVDVIIKDGTQISDKKLASYLDRFQAVAEKSKVYETTLDNRLASVEGASDMLQNVLTKLASRVKK